MELVIKNEKQLKKIEDLLSEGATTVDLARAICSDPRTQLKLLSKEIKTMDEYQTLCIQDSELSFKATDFGSLKYMGQVRMVPVFAQHDMDISGKYHQQGASPTGRVPGNQAVVDYEYARCGYGKLVWPDGSNFEGYWINGQAIGMGVFRAPEPGCETYEGFWQNDQLTNLCVFRQNAGQDMVTELENLAPGADLNSQQEKCNGKGVEVWSDGSYYHGMFRFGVKEGEGCYFWADGSKYTGMWSQDEMSGYGCFQWADGRYFQGSF